MEIKEEKRYTIYCHICPDGKRYIGMTSMPLEKRFGNGKCYKETSRFGEAIKEFGWKNITHIVLEKELRFDEASEKEKHYIKLYKTTETDFGYNMAEGGNIKVVRGRNVSAETRKKLSDSNRGQKRSERTRENLRISHIGKESHNIRSVIKMNLEGNELKEYISMIKAVEDNEKVSQTSIWRACTGRRKTAGGYRWKYKDKKV